MDASIPGMPRRRKVRGWLLVVFSKGMMKETGCALLQMISSFTNGFILFYILHAIVIHDVKYLTMA